MNKKNLLIILAILLFLAVFLGYYLLRQKKLSDVANYIKETSLDTKNYLAFVGSNSCNDISDEVKKTTCYNSLNEAMNSTTTDSCNSLSNVSDIMLCRKASYIKSAILSLDTGSCDKLEDEASKSLCVAQVTMKLAISSGDKKYCENMTIASDKSLCLKILAGPILADSKAKTPLDTDLDGLSNDEEAKFGTKKTELDTDGDGHGDGEEIKSGYNPCGTGKLPAHDQLVKECGRYSK